MAGGRQNPEATRSVVGLSTPDSLDTAIPPPLVTAAKPKGSPARGRRSSLASLGSRPALPTPRSNSPTTTNNRHNRLPPSFEPGHQRYPSNHSPWSPYRPGEYGRSGRGLASDRTRIERKLFDDDDDEGLQERDRAPSAGKRGSSPLAPAFESNMVLRNGASVDLISWLRTNFHHVPEHQHNSMTPSMSLIGIRALLLERFPRVPDPAELSQAVSAAFPRSTWEVSKGAFGAAEPPTLRGLIWHGKDVADEDDEAVAPAPTNSARARKSKQQQQQQQQQHQQQQPAQTHPSSRSPTQSTLASPNSSRRPMPATPARSVLEEFAEIATLADKTPVSKAKSLPGDCLAPSPAYALANICNSFDQETTSRKRRASQSPEPGHRRRASTPDKLHGLLAAAEAVEGSPITSVLGHKRRRTIGGPTPMRDIFQPPSRRMLSRGTVSPPFRSMSYLPGLHEAIDRPLTTDLLVPLNDTASAVSLTDLETASLAAQARPNGRANTSSSSAASQISNASSAAPAVPASTTSRRANELPTQGDNPGVDCKPPYPYHEMIRHAIEQAPDRRLQLSQIYSSIADRFPFFKTLDEKKTSGWQNSIRHNLSLKKMFVRVNKVDGVPDDSGGKGGWWTVQMGVPDEGRPGRKTKGKKRPSNDAVESIVEGQMSPPEIPNKDHEHGQQEQVGGGGDEHRVGSFGSGEKSVSALAGLGLGVDIGQITQ